jgi:hypothetical protein
MSNVEMAVAQLLPVTPSPASTDTVLETNLIVVWTF